LLLISFFCEEPKAITASSTEQPLPEPDFARAFAPFVFTCYAIAWIFYNSRFTILFKQPPAITDDKGQERTVGFELEFTGVTLDQASEALTQALGGEVVEQHKALQTINVADLGEFQVELDWAYLKDKAEQRPGADYLTLLRDAASLVVPVEVVCPPIPITALNKLDPLVNKLREAGARGTDDSFIAACGVHINASLPALDADTIHRHIKASRPLLGVNQQRWIEKIERCVTSNELA